MSLNKLKLFFISRSKLGGNSFFQRDTLLAFVQVSGPSFCQQFSDFEIWWFAQLDHSRRWSSEKCSRNLSYRALLSRQIRKFWIRSGRRRSLYFPTVSLCIHKRSDFSILKKTAFDVFEYKSTDTGLRDPWFFSVQINILFLLRCNHKCLGNY